MKQSALFSQQNGQNCKIASYLCSAILCKQISNQDKSSTGQVMLNGEEGQEKICHESFVYADIHISLVYCTLGKGLRNV